MSENLFDSWDEPEKENVPVGLHKGVISGAKVVKPDEGNAYVEWEVRVTDLPQSTGRNKIWQRRYLTPAAVWTLKKDFKALGVEKFDDPKLLAGRLETCLEKEVTVNVKYRKYQGKEYPNIEFVSDDVSEAPKDDLPF